MKYLIKLKFQLLNVFDYILGEGLNFLDLQSMHVAQTLLVVYEMGLFITKFVLSHPNMKKLLASGEKFDVVIVECFVDEALFGIAQHFDAPLISMATFGAHKWNTDQVGSEFSFSFCRQLIILSSI